MAMDPDRMLNSRYVDRIPYDDIRILPTAVPSPLPRPNVAAARIPLS